MTSQDHFVIQTERTEVELWQEGWPPTIKLKDLAEINHDGVCKYICVNENDLPVIIAALQTIQTMLDIKNARNNGKK